MKIALKKVLAWPFVWYWNLSTGNKFALVFGAISAVYGYLQLSKPEAVEKQPAAEVKTEVFSDVSITDDAEGKTVAVSATNACSSVETNMCVAMVDFGLTNRVEKTPKRMVRIESDVVTVSGTTVLNHYAIPPPPALTNVPIVLMSMRLSRVTSSRCITRRLWTIWSNMKRDELFRYLNTLAIKGFLQPVELDASCKGYHRISHENFFGLKGELRYVKSCWLAAKDKDGVRLMSNHVAGQWAGLGRIVNIDIGEAASIALGVPEEERRVFPLELTVDYVECPWGPDPTGRIVYRRREGKPKLGDYMREIIRNEPHADGDEMDAKGCPLP